MILCQVTQIYATLNLSPEPPTINLGKICKWMPKSRQLVSAEIILLFGMAQECFLGQTFFKRVENAESLMKDATERILR